MKALSLPISSPSRVEKFTPPQPLMRFLTGNVVSRSRARSRAIPIFGKKNAAGLIDETTREPSSPKVTCIGQVRARSATSESALNPRHTTGNRRRWWWLKKPLFGYKLPCRFRRYKTFRGLLFRWFLCCSRAGYGKKVDAREDSFVVESNPNSDKNEYFEAKVREIVPVNALSLTRYRPVPRRSSYLGGRICESTSESCELGELKTENEPKTLQNFQEIFTNFNPEISHESCKELGNTKSVVEDLNGIFGVATAHPLLLKRCKSGPARTA
ncbi:uncharacterized protein LOC142550765 [Primulina tabacum]|uniref:uncharacterized protein LOC142550765 n=1 Tax=Primulina tabacum TaxID=48773 RepID=UPI003F59B3D5